MRRPRCHQAFACHPAAWLPGLLCGILLLVLAGCTEEEPGGEQPVSESLSSVDQGPTPAPVAEDPVPLYVGDLDTLQEHGSLRILIPANIGGVFYLPREGWPVEAQHEAAVAFAQSQGLEPVLVPVENLAEMIPSLVQGRGDIVAANLTITAARRERIAFSVPLTSVRQQVLVASGEDAIKAVADLAGRRVMVAPSSSFWERLETLRKRHPTIELVPRPPDMTDEQELDAVADGEVDASVRDSNIADMYLGYRDDLKVAFELSGIDDIAWGVRRDAPKLRAALNEFLHLEPAARPDARIFTGDLDAIKKRRVLRVLLRNNAASYFLYKGELQGFEYELAKAFAKANRLRLQVVVPESHDQMLQWLREGRGDVAAGFLEPDPLVAETGVAYSRPYHHAPRHLVVRADDPIEGLEGLRGRSVTVRRSSPYWKDLQKLQEQGHGFELLAAPEDLETEALIEQVADGTVDTTVADGHLLDIELARGLPVKSGIRISEDRPHAVAVRSSNPKLLAALDGFIKKKYRGLVYNVLYKKYFTSQRQVRNLAAGRPRAGGDSALSPYDEVTRELAERYNFDWRLIVAQMFQESRFDPKAKSFAGAQGLMQVLPRTARFMGFETIKRPEEGIHAGVKYLDWIRNRFEADLPVNERMWFTLAAYNAGHGHVQDARRLARKKGWDGDRWFGNVERAMLLLSKKKYAGKARYGYVRGIEPVSYVRNIRERYRAYIELSEGAVARVPAAPSGPAQAGQTHGRSSPPAKQTGSRS